MFATGIKVVPKSKSAFEDLYGKHEDHLIISGYNPNFFLSWFMGKIILNYNESM